MMQGLLTALKAELFVAARSRSTQLLCAAPGIAALLQLLITATIDAGSEARDALAAGNSGFGTSARIEGADAWGALVDALGTGLALVSLLAVTYAAWSFASDRDLGVVRHLVIRRISRPAVLASKLLMALLLTLLSVIFLLLLSSASVALLWDLGPVTEDGYELIGVQEIRSELGLGLMLALIPIPAGIALGVLLSVLAGSSTQALSAALGLTLGLDLFKSVLGTTADYLFVSYQVSLLDESYLNDVARLVRGYSDVMLDPRMLQLNQWIPWPQMLIFVALSMWLVQRKPL